MRKLNVYLKEKPSKPVLVGVLAETSDKRFFFEYDSAFLEKGVNISPFKLRLAGGLLETRDSFPPRIHGAFYDSIPDGWGLLLMVFNVLSYNRDDHGRNFAFRMASDAKWSFAPPYDLMFSYGPGGEHSTSVAGEGTHPSTKEFNRLAELSGVTRVESEGIIGEVRESVKQWPKRLTLGVAVANLAGKQNIKMTFPQFAELWKLIDLLVRKDFRQANLVGHQR
jgi:hypothetical protein